MQLHRLGKSLFGKAALATAALSGLFFFAGAPGAQAADRDDDHRRVNTERGFTEDRGYYSRQADRWSDGRHEASERRYAPAYRYTWDGDRDDHRYYDDHRNDRDRDDNRFRQRDRD